MTKAQICSYRMMTGIVLVWLSFSWLETHIYTVDMQRCRRKNKELLFFPIVM